MDLLFTVIISGMAVGYLTEFVSIFWSNQFVKVGLTITLSVVCNYLLGVQDVSLFVASPAAGFFAAFVVKVATRPVVVNSSRRG